MAQYQNNPINLLMNELNNNNNINNNFGNFNNQMPVQLQNNNQKQQTIRNFPPNNQYTNSMNNMKSDAYSLLNRITSSIKIEAHPHPLYSCFLIRNQNQNGWTCGNCGNNYGITIPSFYCTNCDYSFCQNCLMQYPLYKIRFYDYSTNKDFNVGINQNNSNYYNPNIHKHPLAVIQIENYQNANYVIHCLNCKGDIKLSDSFYYCSLCNFYVCGNCFNNSQKVQQVNQKKNSQNIFEQRGNIKQAFNPGNNNNNPQFDNRDINNGFSNNNQISNNSFNNINFNNNNNQFNMSNNYNNQFNMSNNQNNISNNYNNQNNQINNNNNAQRPNENGQRDLEFQNYIRGNRKI